MLRTTSSILTRLTLNDAKSGSSAFALEFVRWRRKPRWLPVAKSKVFRVPERKREDPEERAELMRLHNNYKTQMRAVRKYLHEEVERLEETSTADHIVLTPEQEEAEFQRCLKENETWNQTIASEREARLAKERKAREVLINERLELARVREEERLERVEAIVKREKELAKTFITRENLDAAIEQALANPVDYNFAMDLQGNIYRGRTTVPGGAGSGGSGSGAPATSETEQTEQQQLQARN